ncbi:hypothetical protein [Priestia aryabhattai]|uniref:Uncharacterized protein n=1 Tax=Priestia aryabhattai TaxID=412384 RepID=A0ABD7X6I1_PRIAR|nr:hypothetical protein [Priestia aryabhattai]WEA47324.1 hypothetical protein PWO00_28525 [Priestia aryabhattai]
MSEVKVWYMTEEERLEYIKKNPIVPRPLKKGDSFKDIHKARRRSLRTKGDS